MLCSKNVRLSSKQSRLGRARSQQTAAAKPPLFAYLSILGERRGSAAPAPGLFRFNVSARSAAEVAFHRDILRICRQGEFAGVAGGVLLKRSDVGVRRRDIDIEHSGRIAIGRLDLEQLTRGAVLRGGDGDRVGRGRSCFKRIE